MTLGLFGGSFDPIHYGHLNGAAAVRKALGLEGVVFLPTAVPPHKPGRRLAPAVQRYAMVELALLGEPTLAAAPYEMDDEPAYTWQTIERVRADGAAGDEPVLIVGADSFAAFTSWRRWRFILRRARLAVLARPGFDLSTIDPELRRALDSGRAVPVPLTPHEASSTEVRRRLAAGEDIDDLVPRRVVRYIRKYRLYGARQTRLASLEITDP